jgi:hypothetical protein
MATPVPRRRKTAEPSVRPHVKASLVVCRDLHTRWHAAASLSGMTANAFAVEALTEACKGIVIVDRRKTTDRVRGDDRPREGIGISSDAGEEAA